MRAVRLTAGTGVEGLAVEDVPTPSPGEGEVLVRVHAAALTRDELNWPVDRLPAIPSYEVSGVIAEVGPGMTGFEVGDEVYGLTGFERDGVAAEFAAIASDRLAPKPSSLSHAEAAAIPLAGLSATQGLFDHGGLEPGQRVLIHGGAGGVGAFAVQLAKIHGAHAIATATGRRVAIAVEIGADEVIDIQTQDLTQIEQVDLVLDTVGGRRLTDSFAVVGPGGRIVSIAEPPPEGLGVKDGIESIFFIVEPNSYQLAELARLSESGALRVFVDSTYPLEHAQEAFHRLQSGDAIGKVVLAVHGE